MIDEKENKIVCPECGKENGLSLHMIADFTSINVPVVDGKAIPTYEILLESKLTNDDYLLKYSDTLGQTKIMIHSEDTDISLHCKQCQKMYALPKGSIKCDVE